MRDKIVDKADPHNLSSLHIHLLQTRNELFASANFCYVETGSKTRDVAVPTYSLAKRNLAYNSPNGDQILAAVGSAILITVSANFAKKMHLRRPFCKSGAACVEAGTRFKCTLEVKSHYVGWIGLP